MTSPVLHRMFVANCTQQEQAFLYRLPNAEKARRVLIPIGGQTPLPDQLTIHQVEGIVRQHAKYGLLDVTEVDQRRTFAGLCYSLDKPVTFNKMNAVIEQNTDRLEDMGKKLRQEAAVATAAVINQNNPQNPLSALEMSVVEQTKKDNETPTIAEGVRVAEGEAPGPTPGAAKRASTRAGGKKRR